MENYGKELILDIHDCDPELFNRKNIKKYFIELCKLINMKRECLYWWDYKGHPEEYRNAPSHLKGITAVQFISTSNITVHTLDDLKRIYLNIFSCKDFDAIVVAKFTEKYFNGKRVSTQIIDRI